MLDKYTNYANFVPKGDLTKQKSETFLLSLANVFKNSNYLMYLVILVFIDLVLTNITSNIQKL